jgi:hypothetical protein
MHPKHFIPRSKGAGVCMSIIENVGSTYLRSKKATRSTGKHRVELSMPRNSLELFLFMFGFHALYPGDATLSQKLEWTQGKSGISRRKLREPAFPEKRRWFGPPDHSFRSYEYYTCLESRWANIQEIRPPSIL